MLNKIMTVVGLQESSDMMAASEYKFMAYVSEHGKMYGTKAEFNYRQGLFTETLANIEAHNAKGESYEMGINHMSDWSEEEYNALLGYKHEMKKTS